MGCAGPTGGGRTLVFLHGWSVDGSLFSGQRALARQGMRIAAPDLPGHGDTPIAGTAPTISGLAGHLDALLAGLGGTDIVLVGWSMGATVALDLLARRGAERIAGLVIVDMTPKVTSEPGWPHGLAGEPGLAEALAVADRMEEDWPRYVPRIAEAMFAAGRSNDDPLVARVARQVAARDPAVMASLWRSLVVQDHRETLRRLACPVLAIAGGASRLYRPQVARWIAANAPRGRCVEMAGAGHAPHVEQPEAFNRLVADFALAC